MSDSLNTAGEPPAIAITLLDGQNIPGRVPVVLVGPNGSGKTRYGVALSKANSYDRIPALRSLTIHPSIPFQKYDDAKRNADQEIRTAWEQVGHESQEINSILSELKAEDAQSAVEYRNAARQCLQGPPEETNLSKLLRLWERTLPGRQLDLTTYDPRTSWAHPSRPAGAYGAHEMSDGERGALYLIARILRAQSGVVVVDEPEVHFHSLLARSFWDMIESERSDCRFIYITHDLPFTLSRRGARIALVRDQNTADLVPDDAPIPDDVFEEVLGAASLSVVAKRIVFCEGGREKSIDSYLYGAWLNNPDTVVVPVGSGVEVQRAAAALKRNPTIVNANCIGIIERDYWSDTYLDARRTDGMHILPTHEVEGLLCLRDVAGAVAQHLAVDKFDEKYTAFERDVRGYFIGVHLHKLVLERAKRAVEERLVGIANQASPMVDSATTRQNFCAAVDLAQRIPDVGSLFDSQLAFVKEVLARPAEEFLKVLPGKDCLQLLLRQLGVEKERYVSLIVKALRQSDADGSDLRALGAHLENALESHLPPRSVV